MNKNGQPITDDESALLKSWNALSERNKGKIEYHIDELIDSQAQQKNDINRKIPSG